MDKKVTKMIELILAANCFGLLYYTTTEHITCTKSQDIFFWTKDFQWHNRKCEFFDNLSLFVQQVTWAGYLFLFIIIVIATISGEAPQGAYAIFFNVCGMVLIIISIIIILVFQNSYVPFILGSVCGIALAIILLLDTLNIVF